MFELDPAGNILSVLKEKETSFTSKPNVKVVFIPKREKDAY